MAHPLRIDFPGAFYDVTSRGNDRKGLENFAASFGRVDCEESE